MSAKLIKRMIQKLRKHRGMSELLTYLIHLDQVTILHKDGSLSRHYRYIAPDCLFEGTQEFEYHAQTWCQSFQLLGNGWLVETNVLSQLVNNDPGPGAFPEIPSAIIDDDRRIQQREDHHFESTYYLSLTWKPDQRLAANFEKLALDSDSSHLSEQLKQFNQIAQKYIKYLERSLLEIKVLSGDTLITFLHQCLTGETTRLKQPQIGAFLDCYLAEPFVAGFQPLINDIPMQILCIDDVPGKAYPAILDTLSAFPVAYRWSSRFIPFSQATARQILKRYEKSWSSKAIGVLGVIKESLGLPTLLNRDAEETAEQCRKAQTANASGELRYGLYNSNLILRHEDQDFLNKTTLAIIGHIQKMDFKIRKETINATEAYLGSLPGHGIYNLRQMPMDTDFMSCVLPISALYQGERQAPCPLSGYPGKPALLVTTTQGHRPFYFNCHVNDVGHTLVLGPTGSGKTTLNALLMARHRKYRGSRVIVFDKDYSNYNIIRVLEGNYYDLNKNDCELAPLSRLSSDPYTVDQAINWLETIFAIQKLSLNPKQHKALREAIIRLAAEEPQYKNLNHLTLQDKTLRMGLSAFNRDSYQQLLNGTQPAFADQEVIGFEMGGLMKGSQAITPFGIPVIQAIFDELETLFLDQRPTLFILEEGWLYLSHPLLVNKLSDWFKTLRKKNVAVILVSQDLADISQSRAASVIQSSCLTRVYLPNAAAQEALIKQHYQDFGLRDDQIAQIQKMTPKQDYYYSSPLGHRIFQLELGAVTQGLISITDKKDSIAFEKIYERDNPRWVMDWLEYKKVPDWPEWKTFLENNYFRDIP